MGLVGPARVFLERLVRVFSTVCMGFDRDGEMNGIVVVDKAAGMTSAQVVAAVKRSLRVKKVGHTGTLDPFATGVLVCCVNQATRLAGFLMEGKKRYEGVMHLGVETDTQDVTGRCLSKASSLSVTTDQVETVFRRFLGTTEQIPPSFSALKYRGVPLYELARKGVFVQKEARPVAIYHLAVLEVKLPFVHFEVCCSQGTYIRTLCADMGKALGCGAHLAALRRTESGGFGLDEALSLENLEGLKGSDRGRRFLIPMSRALRGGPEVQVGCSVEEWIRQGRPVGEDKIGPVEDRDAAWIKITDKRSNLIAVLGARKRDGVFPYKCVFPNTERRASC